MKKFALLLISLCLFVLVILLLTGGVLVYLGPRYQFDREFSLINEGEGFIPSDFYIVRSYNDIPAIPLLLHLQYSTLPKDIKLSKHDISYLRSHEGFSRFRIDELSLNHDNGRKLKIITPHHPESDKEFLVSEDWQDTILFSNVIAEKSSFVFRLVGVSYAEDGRGFPFHYEARYNYSFQFWITTRFLMWASV
jgi:hypothetical protein